MLAQKATSWFCAALAAAAVCAPAGAPAGQLNLGPQELVSTTGGPIAVPGYSVPSLVDWNADGRQDLLVGEGGAWETRDPAVSQRRHGLGAAVRHLHLRRGRRDGDHLQRPQL